MNATRRKYFSVFIHHAYFYVMNRIEKIQEMLKASPNDNFLRHALALEMVKEGNDEEAKQLFLQILNESPDYIGSYYHLAKLLERNGDIESAILWYEKGMKAAKEAKDNHAYTELQSAYEDLVY
jgi:tetratricopeptide (TPR) repeat protein